MSDADYSDCRKCSPWLYADYRCHHSAHLKHCPGLWCITGKIRGVIQFSIRMTPHVFSISRFSINSGSVPRLWHPPQIHCHWTSAHFQPLLQVQVSSYPRLSYQDRCRQMLQKGWLSCLRNHSFQGKYQWCSVHDTTIPGTKMYPVPLMRWFYWV